MTDRRVNDCVGSRETSSTLLVRIKAKEPEAWQRFVHLYSPLIYNWCRDKGLREEDAADVGQDVFRAVLRGIDNFDHTQERSTFRGWLRTITRSKLCDYARRLPLGGQGVGGSDALTKIQNFHEEEARDDEDSERDELILLRRAIELVLAEFEEKTQKAFLRVELEHHLPEDVADELGMNLNSVYLAKSRIKKRLREEFGSFFETL